MRDQQEEEEVEEGESEWFRFVSCVVEFEI